jgi:hypothetical protein
MPPMGIAGRAPLAAGAGAGAAEGMGGEVPPGSGKSLPAPGIGNPGLENDGGRAGAAGAAGGFVENEGVGAEGGAGNERLGVPDGGAGKEWP